MTQRLFGLLLSHWDEVLGFSIAQRMDDITEMDPDRLTSFLWWYFTRNAEPATVARFRARLWVPPAGEAPDPRSPWAPEAETAAFSAFQAQFSGSVPKPKGA